MSEKKKRPKPIVFTAQDAKDELKIIEDEIISATERSVFHQSEVDRLVMLDEVMSEHVRKRNLQREKIKQFQADKRSFERMLKRLEGKEELAKK